MWRPGRWWWSRAGGSRRTSPRPRPPSAPGGGTGPYVWAWAGDRSLHDPFVAQRVHDRFHELARVPGVVAYGVGPAGVGGQRELDRVHSADGLNGASPVAIGRAHDWTPVTRPYR